MVDELLTAQNVTAAPVPVERIVKQHGVLVRRADLGDVSGLLVREKEEIFIGLNESENRTRQRFTLSHEFGHFLLHEGKPVRYDKAFRVNLRSDLSSQASDVEEMEANFFAASLLMPRKFLERDVRNYVVDLEDAEAVADLARRYDVSLQAMNIRMLSLFGAK